MSYIEDNLSNNEKVLFRAYVSKAIFIPCILAEFVSILFFVGATNKSFFQIDDSGRLFSLIIAVALFVYAFGLLIKAIILVNTTEFAVTNRRLIAKTGFIRRHTVEMLLMKVESVSVHQKVMQRLFDMGSITITGTGGTREVFRYISQPLEVRKKINEILEAYMRAYASYQERQKDKLNQGGW